MDVEIGAEAPLFPEKWVFLCSVGDMKEASLTSSWT